MQKYYKIARTYGVSWEILYPVLTNSYHDRLEEDEEYLRECDITEGIASTGQSATKETVSHLVT